MEASDIKPEMAAFDRNGKAAGAIGHYHKNGLSVIVIKQDKRSVGPWAAAQKAAPTAEHLAADLQHPNAGGLGIVCGQVSGNLEVIDIDVKYDLTGNLADRLFQMIEEQAPELFKRLLIAQTPTGGFHIYFRCECIQGNQKLARRPASAEELARKPEDKVRVLIETRGEGGYVAAFPTPGYCFYQKNEIPVITIDERELLLDCCRSFNELMEAPRAPKDQSVGGPAYEVTPWDDYNARVSIEEVAGMLEATGWRREKQNSTHIYFRRPGKDQGISGDLLISRKLLRVWSTSTPFDTERPYTPTGVFAVLKCNGNEKEAFRQLTDLGYGQRRQEERPAGTKKAKKDELGQIEELQAWLREQYTFRRNEITRYIELKGRPMKQVDFNSIYIEAKKKFPKLTYDLLDRTINSHFTPTYNPIIDWIEASKSRRPEGAIEAVANTIDSDTGLVGSEFFPEFKLHFFRKWVVSIIASIYGEHSPQMFVLTGSQGSGKTEFFRRLLPKELSSYYAESKLDAGKDDEILMTQKLLICDDEMGGKSKKDEKLLKELLSKQTFSLREPYGRNNVDLQRLAVLCGTTNDIEILSDPTGNRRIIPVNVLSIDQEAYNSVDKTDLLIEAYHLYKSGFNWRLTSQDVRDLNANTSHFEQTSPERELLSRYFRKPKGEEEAIADYYTASEIKAVIKRHTMQEMNLTRLGLEMKNMGFEKVARKRNGQAVRGFYVMDLTKSGVGLSGGC